MPLQEGKHHVYRLSQALPNSETRRLMPALQFQKRICARVPEGLPNKDSEGPKVLPLYEHVPLDDVAVCSLVLVEKDDGLESSATD